MFCGIIDYFSPTTSFSALRSMGEPFCDTLPRASAYLCGGVGLFHRSSDPFLTYPLTRTVSDKSYILMLDGTPLGIDPYALILKFSRKGEAFLRTLCGKFSLALFDSSCGVLYLLRTAGSKPVFFSGDIRLVFATSEDSLAAFPERLYGISRLRENSILRYDVQGVKFV